MGKEQFREWLKQRNPDTQSVGGLKGLKSLGTLVGEMESGIDKIKTVGGVYNFPGVTPSTYDKEVTESYQMESPEALNQFRADTQSGAMKAVNAVAGGVLSGLLTAVETTGYLMDLPNNIAQIMGIESTEDNAISQFAQDAKQSVYGALPIYEDVESNGVMDQFTRFSTLRSMLDSAIGFAIPGGGVMKGLGFVSKATRAGRLGAYLRLTTGLKNPEKLGKAAEALTGGLITNYGEGKMMALELGDDLKRQYVADKTQKLLVEKYNGMPQFADMASEEAEQMFESDKDVKTEIGRQQSNFITNNTIFALTDAIGLHNIGLTKKATRNVLEARRGGGAKEILKRSFTASGGMMRQNIKEGAEEIGQNMFQMEAGYQARENLGIQTPEDELLGGTKMDRYISFATSDKAMLEGLMGFVSGGLQRKLTEGFADVVSGDPLGKNRRAEYDKLYETQQKAMANYTSEKAKDILTSEMFKEDFLKDGTEPLVDMVDNTLFNKMATEAVSIGTVEPLERLLTDTANLSTEEAAKRGYGPKYKEQAQNRIKELRNIEQIYLDHSEFKTQNILTSNRVAHKTLVQSKQVHEDLLTKPHTTEDNRVVESQLEALNKAIVENQITLANEDGEVVSEITLENLASIPSLKNAESVINLTEYKKAIKTFEGLVKLTDAISENAEKYKFILKTVEPNFEEYVEKQTKAAEKAVGVENAQQLRDAELELRQSLEQATGIEEQVAIIESFSTKYADSPIATSIKSLVNKVTTELQEDTKTVEDGAVGSVPADFEIFQSEMSEFTKDIPEQASDVLMMTERLLDNNGDITMNAIKSELTNASETVKQMQTPGAVATFNSYINTLQNYYNSKVAASQNAATKTTVPLTPTVPEGKTDISGEGGVHVSNSAVDEQIDGAIKQTVATTTRKNLVETGLSVEEVEQEIANEDTPGYEFKRVGSWKSIMYLARQFKTRLYNNKITFTDAENFANAPEILRNLQEVTMGSKVEFRIVDDPNLPVYNTNKEGVRTKSTWGELAKQYPADKHFLYIPMAIMHNDKLVGYVQAFDNLNPNKDKDYSIGFKQLQSMREVIYKANAKGKPNLTSTVTNITSGHLIKAVNNNLLPVDFAFPANEVKIAIFKKGKLSSIRNSELPKVINVKELQEGFTYAIVPYPQGSIAIPLQRNDLTKVQVANITTAMSLFIKSVNGQGLTVSEKATLDLIQSDLKSLTKQVGAEMLKVNFNVATLEGLRNYISIFTHLHRAPGPKFSLLDEVATRTSNSKFKAVAIEQSVEKAKPAKSGEVSATNLVGRTFIKFSTAISNEASTAYKYFPATSNNGAFLTIIKSTGHGASRVNNSTSFVGEEAVKKMTEAISVMGTHLSGMTFTPSLTALQNPNKINISNLSKPSEATPITYSDYTKQNTSSNLISLNIGTDEKPEYIYTQQRKFSFDETFSKKTNKPRVKKDKNTPSEIINAPVENPKFTQASDGMVDEDGGIPDNSEFMFSLDEMSTPMLQGLRESQIGISIFTPNFAAAPPSYQSLEVETVVELMAQKLLNSPNNKLTSKQWREIMAERVMDLKARVKPEFIKKGNKATIAFIDEITTVQAQTELEKLVVKAFKERAGIRTNVEHNAQVEGDEDFTGETGYAEKLRYTDSYSFEVDPRLTMSTKIKLALSTVPSGKRGIGNVVLSQPFDEVCDRCMAILAGSEPSYTAMVATLEKYSKAYPWIPELLIHLSKQDESVRNGFVVTMHKHYVNMLFLAWKRAEDKNSYVMKVWRANSNAIERTLSEQWFSRLIRNEEFVKIGTNGKYQFTNKAKEIAKTVKGVNIITDENSHTAQKIAINNLLNPLGIYLSDITMDEIIDNGLYYAGARHKYTALFGENGFVVRDLYGKILSANDTLNEEDDVNIFSGGYIQALLKLEGKYTKMNLSNSHRTGNKTVTSYAENKYLIDKVNSLKTDRVMLTSLTKMPFSKRSPLLKTFAKFNFDTNQFVYASDGLVILNNSESATDSDKKNFENFGLNYIALDAIKEIASEYVGDRSLQDLGGREHDGIKAAFFFNNNAVSDTGQRNGQMFYLTMSNKTTMATLQVPLTDFTLNEDGSISEETITRFVENLVMSEVDRMQSHKVNTKNGTIATPLAEYDEGAQIFYTVAALNNIPELFEEINGKRFIKAKYNSTEALLPVIKDVMNKFLERTIEDQLKNWNDIGFGYNSKTDSFNFLDKSLINFYKTKNTKTVDESDSEYNQRIFKAMTFDYVGNYMFHNMSMLQLIAKDPAIYYDGKTKSDNLVEVVRGTFINIGKRLAADGAPGMQGDFSNVGTTYRVGYVKDTKLQSEILSIYKKMGMSDKDLDSYKNITSTDGAELTTAEEHFKIMFVFNKITKAQYDSLMDKLHKQQLNPKSNEYDYNRTELNMILNDINLTINKPVQVVDRIVNYPNSNEPAVDTRVYIKSAATPLLPQLTKGLQLDALRKRMESGGDPSNKIDRIAFTSAIKVGLPSGAIQIFNKDSKNIDEKALANIPVMTLDRSGFRIQQEVPYREDHENVNDGSQQRELLFAGLLDIPELSEMHQTYLDIYNSIYKQAYNKLVDEIEYNPKNNSVNTAKVLEIIKKEATDRNYSINNLVAIGLTEDNKLKYPLWGLPADSSIESLLLSIVDNRIRKIKLPGATLVLSPQEGYNLETDSEGKVKAWEDIKGTLNKNDMLFTEAFDGTLLPMRPSNPNDVNSPWLPAQILISPVLKDAFGKDINIRDFAIEKEGRWVVDTNVIPQELLRGFGFRIPTSSHSSMSTVEIVGFLPEYMKEMVVAPRDFIAQMGSDFDVDKLYSNLYQLAYSPTLKKFIRLEELSPNDVTAIANLEYSKRTKVPKTIGEMPDNEEDFIEDTKDVEKISALEGKLKTRVASAKYFNKLLDIHLDVMAHPATNKLRMQTVSYGELEDLARKFETVKGGDMEFNALSPLYQKSKYVNATAGQKGVGVFSAALVFLASAQAAQLNYTLISPVNGANMFKVTIDGRASTGDMTNASTLDGSTTRLSIMSRFQNASVDDEKLQALSALNINSTTFNAYTAGTMFGFTESQLTAVINQPVIEEFVARVKARTGAFAEYSSDVENSVGQELLQEVLDARGITSDKLEQFNMEVLSKVGKFRVADLQQYIGKSDSEDAIYQNVQYYALKTFLKLREAGQDILKVQNAVNISSKGIGKSLIEASKKYISISNIAKYSPNINNVENLIGRYQRDENGKLERIVPKTIRGFVAEYALKTALSIYNDPQGNPLFPYVNREFTIAVDKILKLSGKSDATGEAYIREVKKIFSALKGYIYTKPEVFGINNPKAEQRRLLMDKKYSGNETYEPGYNLNGVKYSLAGLLNYMAEKNHPLINANKFLKRLQLTINQEGLPSTITYKATVAQSMEESAIYNDFMQLLLSDASITLEENAETLNLTLRQLATDLIKYTYLTGGVQGPSEFVRYIPMQYLINTGVGNELNAINFGSAKLYGDETSGFMLQYFQSYPNRVAATFPGNTKVDTKTLEYFSPSVDYQVDDNGYIVSFVPSDKFALETGLPTLMKAELGRGRYDLLMYDEGSDTYYRISTLRHKNISEFQANVQPGMVAQSSFITNVDSNAKLTVKGVTKSTKGVKVNTQLSDRQAYLEKYFPNNTGYALDALSLMLSDMVPGAAAANPQLREITKKLINAMDKYGVNPKIDVLSLENMPRGARGAYNTQTGDILIRSTLPSESAGIRPAAYFATSLVHESTHALLQNFITMYEQGQPIPKNIAIALGKLQNVLNYSSTKASLEKVTDIEIKHGVSNLSEFVSAITSSEQFRNYISKSSNKNRLIDILIEIFSAIFGIDVNNSNEMITFVDQNVMSILDTLAIGDIAENIATPQAQQLGGGLRTIATNFLAKNPSIQEVSDYILEFKAELALTGNEAISKIERLEREDVIPMLENYIDNFYGPGVNLQTTLTEKENTSLPTNEDLLNGESLFKFSLDNVSKSGVDFVFNQNPELNKIGNKQQYSRYLSTIFPDSKVKDIVYHGSKNEFEVFSKEHIGKNLTGETDSFSFSSSKIVAETYRDSFSTGENTIELAQSFFEDNADILFKEGTNFSKDSKIALEGIKKLYPDLTSYESIEKQKQKQLEFISLFDTPTLYLSILDIKTPVIRDAKGQSKVEFKDELSKLSDLKNYDARIIKNINDWGLADLYQVFNPEQIHILGSKQDIKGFKEFIKLQNEIKSLGNIDNEYKQQMLSMMEWQNKNC